MVRQLGEKNLHCSFEDVRNYDYVRRGGDKQVIRFLSFRASSWRVKSEFNERAQSIRSVQI